MTSNKVKQNYCSPKHHRAKVVNGMFFQAFFFGEIGIASLEFQFFLEELQMKMIFHNVPRDIFKGSTRKAKIFDVGDKSVQGCPENVN